MSRFILLALILPIVVLCGSCTDGSESIAVKQKKECDI